MFESCTAHQTTSVRCYNAPKYIITVFIFTFITSEPNLLTCLISHNTLSSQRRVRYRTDSRMWYRIWWFTMTCTTEKGGINKPVNHRKYYSILQEGRWAKYYLPQDGWQQAYDVSRVHICQPFLNKPGQPDSRWSDNKGGVLEKTS